MSNNMRMRFKKSFDCSLRSYLISSLAAFLPGIIPREVRRIDRRLKRGREECYASLMKARAGLNFESRKWLDNRW